MRISIIADYLDLNLDEGMKKASFNLICSFIGKGMEVSVFTQHAPSLPMEVLQLPENKFLLSFDLARNLRNKSPDLVLYIPSSSGTLGAFIRASMLKILSSGAPVGLLNLQFRRWPTIAHHLGLYRFIDVVFTQSQASTIALGSIGFNTRVLPGAVDRTVFRAVEGHTKSMLRAQYGFPDSSRILLHVGHLQPGRNIAMLAGLAQKGYQVVLVAGTSTGVDRTLLDSLRGAGVTVITEYVQSIQHLYQLADCYLFPVLDALSAADAPLSVFEAMACNLPVLSTRFGALPSMFQPGNGFYFFDVGDDLEPLVKKVLENPNCMTSSMVSDYSWDNMASAILDGFQRGRS